MDQFRSFDQLRTNELSVLRHGFFKLWFELTDGQFWYGKLSYGSLWKTTFILETDKKTWIIKRKGILKQTFLISDAEGANLGSVTPEVWSRKVILRMNDGFEAIYLNKKLFTRTFNLTSNQLGDILNIQSALWSFKTPFKVSLDLDMLKKIPNLPLLALLGVNLLLIKQAKAANAAGG
ncbi:MAG TPA: hypothetical protein VK609_14400 [Mucilaginibacter sp.]|nr:hypothetical protein [Mucilaginibacter sp.]